MTVDEKNDELCEYAKEREGILDILHKVANEFIHISDKINPTLELQNGEKHIKTQTETVKDSWERINKMQGQLRNLSTQYTQMQGSYVELSRDVTSIKIEIKEIRTEISDLKERTQVLQDLGAMINNYKKFRASLLKLIIPLWRFVWKATAIFAVLYFILMMFYIVFDKDLTLFNLIKSKLGL